MSHLTILGQANGEAAMVYFATTANTFVCIGFGFDAQGAFIFFVGHVQGMSHSTQETYMSDSDSTVSVPEFYSDSESIGSCEDIALDVPVDTSDVQMSLLGDIYDAYDDDVVRLYKRNRVLQSLCGLRVYPHIIMSATTIQTAYRRHRRLVVLDAAQTRCLESSIHIQRVMRGYIARNRPTAEAIVRLQKQRIQILRLELKLLRMANVQSPHTATTSTRKAVLAS